MNTNYNELSHAELVARLQAAELQPASRDIVTSEQARTGVTNWSWGSVGQDKLADLQFEVRNEPLVLESSGQRVPDHFAITRTIQERDKYGNLIDKDYIFAIGKKYEIVQNSTMLDLVNVLAETDSAEITNAGIVGHGERCFVQVKRPPHSIVGEEHQSSLLVAWGHDMSTGIDIFSCNRRLCCFNEYYSALRNARGQVFRLRHTRNVHERIDEIRLAVKFAQRQRAVEQERAEYLASVQFTGQPIEYFERWADNVVTTEVGGVPITYDRIRTDAIAKQIGELQSPERDLVQRSFERALQKRNRAVAELQERYETDRNGLHPATGGTLWSLCQTATEFANHSRQSNRFQGSTQARADARFKSFTSGRIQRLNDAAFSLALQMAS